MSEDRQRAARPAVTPYLRGARQSRQLVVLSTKENEGNEAGQDVRVAHEITLNYAKRWRALARDEPGGVALFPLLPPVKSAVEL